MHEDNVGIKEFSITLKPGEITKLNYLGKSFEAYDGRRKRMNNAEYYESMINSGHAVDMVSFYNMNEIYIEMDGANVARIKSENHGFTKLNEWLNMPYKPHEFLDSTEKRYLSGVVRPFKSNVSYIRKHSDMVHREEMERIEIYLKDGSSVCLPWYEYGSMYTGMEMEGKYTIKELGL